MVLTYSLLSLHAISPQIDRDVDGRARLGLIFIMHKYYQLQLLHIHHIQWWAVAAEQKYDRGGSADSARSVRVRRLRIGGGLSAALGGVGVCRVTNLATKIFVRDLYFSTVHSTTTRRDWTMGWVHAILILSYLVTCLYAQGEIKVYRILLQILQKLVLQPHAVIAYVDIRLNRM